MTSPDLNNEYDRHDNIMDAVRKSLNHDNNALFGFLNNSAFELVKGYKNAHSAMIKNNTQTYVLGKSVLVVSELDRLKAELIENQQYWHDEIKKMVSPDGKEEEIILKNQLKQFDGMMIGLMKKIKLTKNLFQRRISGINQLMKEHRIYENATHQRIF